MYVQFLDPSPKAPAREHVSREVGAALIAAGFAFETQMTPEERAALESTNKTNCPAVTWGVTTGNFTGLVVITGRCSHPNCATVRYEGSAKHAAEVKFFHQHATPPESVPDAIVRVYKAAKATENITETADANEFARARWGNPHVVKVNGREVSLRPDGI